MKYQHILASVAALAICAFSAPAQTQSLPIVYNPGIMLHKLSDNGAYAIGTSMGDIEVDNPHAAGGTIIDLATRTHREIPAPNGWADVSDVADNGVVVGSALGNPGYWDPKTNEWKTYTSPRPWGGGCFTAVSPDAKYAVGYYIDAENIYNVAPMMYDLTTGNSIDLPGIPTHDLTGQNRNQNVLFGVSPDGRYVLGEISMSYLSDLDVTTGEMRPALFSYVYDTVNHTWDPIGYTYDAATAKFTPKVAGLHFINNQFMSCDGTWVTGAAYMVYDGGDSMGGKEGFFPYRYEIATGNIDIYTSAADADIAGEKITSDGVVLGSSPMGNPYPTAQIRCGKYFISLDQIIQQVYGLTVFDLIHDSVTGSFESISADGKTALMVTYDNTYIITVPEQFVELAAKVNLLNHYTISIPDGSMINRVSEIELTFDREIATKSTSNEIRLLNSDGTTVRSASGIGVSRTNPNSAVITFRSTSLTPGETYTIDIPEGMIWLKDDPDVKTRHIQINYVGRENGPVKVKSILPADGAAVAQLNANPDVITVTFDTPVAITNDATCALYNADDDSLISYMMGGTQGNQAIFFPVSEYQLYKGSNYKVVISAGSVTDLSGGGGNEEITINYTGAYVRELSADDIYIFNESCDNYDNFMFWQSEFNVPSTIPRGWGFTEETPWILVRDNENTTDMALAAHSMFTPAGESDDWLITPQLYIPDASTYLAFDGQSYLRSRDDVLKVYVYADDAVYNYFSQELADKFRTDGDLIFDRVISAGASDERLEGEWSHYTCMLDKYAGKNIYIAFVNNNYDKSAIFIDNVQVIRNLSFLLTNQTPTAVVDKDDVTISGIITSGSEVNVYQGINLQLVDAEGNVISTIDDANATLAYGDTYNFTFDKPLQLTVGEMTTYEIHIATGNEKSAYQYTIKDLVFEPVKRVVLEEFTGSACPNCPLGILAIENLQRMYPDNFIAVTLRTYTNDIYASGAVEYTAFLGMNAAPTGRINRGEILSPMLQNGSKGYTFYGRGITMSDGTEGYLWADAVQDELRDPAEAEVSATSSLDLESNLVTVDAKVRFALNRHDMSVGVLAVLLENNLPTYQLNNLASISDPILGPWGQGGMYGQQTVTTWLAQDVTRFVVNGNAFNGTLLPVSDFVAGEEYPITISGTLPQNRILEPSNTRMVVMLIDRTSGRIINASEQQISTGGITDMITDADTEAEYYDLQGMRVMEPQKGAIYIEVRAGTARKVKF